MHLRLSVFAVIICCLVFSSGVHAQTTETYSLGGVQHTLIYPAGSNQGEIFKTVLQDTLPVYNRLFGMSSIAMHITAYPDPVAGRPDLLADASPDAANRDVCNIGVYPLRAGVNPLSVGFTIAHEFAHCYQFAARGDEVVAFRRTEGDPNGWWIEGSAEWLASKVYTPIGDPIQTTLTELFTISNVRVFDNDYRQYWFFRFFAEQYGDVAAIDLIRNIPITPIEQSAYLNGVESTREMFGHYGVRIAGNTFPEQPPLTSDTVESFDISAVPGSQALVTDPLSVKIVHLNLPSGASGTGVAVSLAPETDPSYQVLWRDGSEITSDTGVVACRTDGMSGSVFVIVARSDSTTEDASAQINFAEGECDPTPVDTPACMVGTWRLIRLPQVGEPDPTRVENLDGSFLTINANGAAQLRIVADVLMGGPSEGQPLQMNLNMGFEGNYELGYLSPGEYSVIGGTGTVLPDRSMTITVAGITQDVSSSIDSVLSMGMSGGSTTVFSCTPDTLIQTVTAGGQTLIYRYSR